ncbi:MAG: GNAT family N-acetyltransferase [Thiolinea sp.]
MPISIEKLTSSQADEHCSDSVFTHPGFRLALAREYRLEAVNIKLSFAGQPICLPAFLRHNTFGAGGPALIIGAGFDKTGVIPGLADQDYAAAISQLMQALQDNPTGIRQLSLRTTQPIPCQQDHSDKVELSIRLDKPCAERLMDFSKSTRRNIRLPFKQGFHFVMDRQPLLLEQFYQLYLHSMHELGSLPHSYTFFQEILTRCQQDIVIFVGYMDKQPVVASFIFLSDDEAYGVWSGTHPAYKQQNVFLAMLWSVLEFCEQTGRSRYNLGRSSRGSGACQFKTRLANQVRDIHYYQLPIKVADSSPSLVQRSASWVIRNTPPFVMHTLSRSLLHRFY